MVKIKLSSKLRFFLASINRGFRSSLSGSLAALLLLAANPQNAFSQFNEFYQEDETDLPAFDSGGVFATFGGTGYVLTGNSQVDGSPPATYLIPSLARFNDAGTQLWSVFMDGGPDTSGSQLIANPEDSSRFFAGFVEAGVSARVGIFNGSDLSSVFAHQIAMEATDPAKVQLGYLPGELSFILQDLGSSMQLLVLSASGNRVFEKTYASPEFLASEVPLLSTQRAVVAQLPDESGFYISVVRSDLDTMTFKYKNKFFLIKTDTGGTAQWSKTFELDTSFPAVNVAFPLPDNGFLYQLSNIDTTTQITTSHLIKFSDSGALEFSESIEGALLVGAGFNSTEDSLRFTGTISDPGTVGASDIAFVMIDPDSGAIEAQIGINQRVSDFGSFTGSTNNQFYGSLFSTDDFEADGFVTTLFRFDSNLTNPIAFDYGGEDSPDLLTGLLTVKGNDELLFSTFHEPTGSVGAFSLDGNLSPNATGCEEFTAVTLNTFNPGLAVAALAVNPVNFTVTVGDETTALTTTTLPLATLALITEDCVTGGGDVGISTQPASQTVALGANVTFSVSAQGTAPITYQWKKDGVDIEGATASVLLIADAQASDAGSYTVVITDAVGSITSAAATLSFTQTGGPVIVIQPMNQTVEIGGSAALGVAATGTGTLTYQWFKDNVELTGETASTLALANIMEADLGNYVVVVSDGTLSVTSDPANVATASSQNAGFSAYLATLGDVPTDMQGFTDDPDDNNFASGIEYLMGTDAGDGASSPQIIPSTIMIGGEEYFALTYPLNTAITDLTLVVEFSLSIDFATSLGSVEVSAVDLGGGMQRVTVRSASPIGGTTQFARFSAGDE